MYDINERIEIDLPNTLNEAINLAKLNNADLLIDKLDYQIAEREANIEKARLSPSASINYSKSENRINIKVQKLKLHRMKILLDLTYFIKILKSRSLFRSLYLTLSFSHISTINV